MVTRNVLAKSILNFPTVTFPSLLDEVEDLLPANMWPSTNFLQGLSVSDDAKNVYIEAALPGIDAKDAEVLYEKGVLTIRAEKKEEEKEKTFHRKATRSFFYRVTPGDVDQNVEPQATCKNGVMTVTFVKVAEGKPKKIAVKAG